MSLSIIIYLISVIKIYHQILQSMLPNKQKIKTQKDSHICDCNVFSLSSAEDQSQIFLKKNRTSGLFTDQNLTACSKIYSYNKQKHSLKLKRDKGLTQNASLPVFVGQGEPLDQTMTKTDLLTRADSQNIKANYDFQHINHLSCFSSHMFKQSAFLESKEVFGRLTTEIKKVEEANKTPIDLIPICRSSTDLLTQNNGLTSNKEKNQNFSFNQSKGKLNAQVFRHTRSQSGEVNSLPNFYSEQQLHNCSLENLDFQRQVSSIVIKKKTTKRTHRLQELNFKDTESIDDYSSQSFSEVISDESEVETANVQFSQIIIPKPRLHRFSAMPKLSNFK